MGMRPIIVDDTCPICEETYPYFMLQRCSRCGRLYCKNCTVLNDLGEVLCLNCARKMVTPRFRPKSKYAPLSIYLARRAAYTSQVTLKFSRIEEIIGDILPHSAYHSKNWWSNVRNRSPSEAWMTVGWRVEAVNLDGEEVTFRKEEKPASEGTSIPRKRRRKASKKTFREFVRKKSKRRRARTGPSKTKIAIAQARLKNIERARTSARSYRGLKPRSAYEKRLYKPEEKPK